MSSFASRLGKVASGVHLLGGAVVLAMVVLSLVAARVFLGAPLADPAVKYALDWWEKRNTDHYADYNCHDCANFVSQCLIAGGFSFAGAQGVDSHGCITNCDNLAAWLDAHNSNRVSLDEGDQVPSWVGPRCVAIWGDGQRTYQHATFAVGGSGASTTFCAHCNNQGSKSYNFFMSGSQFDRVTIWLPSSGGGGPQMAVAGLEEDRAFPEAGVVCYPNPFNERVVVECRVGEGCEALVYVYDLRGRLVRTLGGVASPSGVQRTVWDGRDQAGELVPSGTYLVRVPGMGREPGTKVLLLR